MFFVFAVTHVVAKQRVGVDAKIYLNAVKEVLEFRVAKRSMNVVEVMKTQKVAKKCTNAATKKRVPMAAGKITLL